MATVPFSMRMSLDRDHSISAATYSCVSSRSTRSRRSSARRRRLPTVAPLTATTTVLHLLGCARLPRNHAHDHVTTGDPTAWSRGCCAARNPVLPDPEMSNRILNQLFYIDEWGRS